MLQVRFVIRRPIQLFDLLDVLALSGDGLLIIRLFPDIKSALTLPHQQDHSAIHPNTKPVESYSVDPNAKDFRPGIYASMGNLAKRTEI